MENQPIQYVFYSYYEREDSPFRYLGYLLRFWTNIEYSIVDADNNGWNRKATVVEFDDIRNQKRHSFVFGHARTRECVYGSTGQTNHSFALEIEPFETFDCGISASISSWANYVRYEWNDVAVNDWRLQTLLNVHTIDYIYDWDPSGEEMDYVDDNYKDTIDFHQIREPMQDSIACFVGWYKALDIQNVDFTGMRKTRKCFDDYLESIELYKSTKGTWREFGPKWISGDQSIDKKIIWGL